MEIDYLDNLHSILVEDEKSTRDREQSSFNALEERIKAKGIILFGCGGFGKRTLQGLRRIGIEPLGFSDNNPRLWNTQVSGLNVYSPEKAISKFPQAVFMVTVWSDAIGHPIDDIDRKLNSYKPAQVVSFFSLYWKYPSIFLPYFSIDSPYKTIQSATLIFKCFDLFKDEASRKEFHSQIRFRLLGDHRGLTEPSKFVQYFPDDLFELSENEIFIDCGAFDGDTLRNFLQKQNSSFHQYIAFEPDPVNCDKLRNFVAGLSMTLRDKILVEQFAVSDTRKQITFSSDGSLQSSFKKDGNITVECVNLDQHLSGLQISYIKMDAEGAEPEIISGAAQIIQQHSPILAVSVYHQFDHLWTLPLLLSRYCKDYTFFLRPHCKASWDLICYAVPNKRKK